ncbi:uncharacterized protein LOC111054180 [Nilaparvata lugens]|uniref:uncharacterized protein LOC111054180 n=1 Tax=Nilaparvata lugens TaxID=108931 RepID=UPI00193E622D|nr:uncharacterized protein LOC111054180 [Nilaparvata lugens]
MDLGRIGIGYLNVQCLRSKLGLVERFCADSKLDILCISEHWLSSEECPHYSFIEELVLSASYCRKAHRGGGVSIYVQSNKRTKEIDQGVFCLDLDIEVAALELVDASTFVISVYRSPNGNIENFFYKLDVCLSKFRCTSGNIIMGGDFNIALNCNEPATRTFVNLLRTHGLYVVSEVPTRGDRCLDSIATNMDSSRFRVHVTDPLVTDHSAVRMTANIHMVSESSRFPTWYCH